MVCTLAPSVSEHVAWLRNSYDLVWKKLANLMCKEDFCEDATNALFVLLAKEGKFPIDSQSKRSYYFPEKKFQVRYFISNLLLIQLIHSMLASFH